MKKLLSLSVFIVLGAVAFAQNGTPSSKTAPALKATAVTVSQSADQDASTQVAVAKKGTKKECSAEEKKACGSKSGKKSCCSSAKKETTN